MSERCGAYAEDWETINMPKGWLGCALEKGHEGDHRDPTNYTVGDYEKGLMATSETVVESDEHRSRKLRISFWKSSLDQYRMLLSISAITQVEATIKDLEKLNERE